MKEAGVSLIIYSTPCLFAAQSAIDEAVRSIHEDHGHLPARGKGPVTIARCNEILEENLSRRGGSGKTGSGRAQPPGGGSVRLATTGR